MISSFEPPSFTPYDWYWAVDGKIWSSKTSAYVQDQPESGLITPIASEQELTEVLRAYGLRGPSPSVQDVIAERNRRMEAGFDYNFGDSRGVHHIATSDADMRGWSEVTDWMNAHIALNDQSATISILTATGQVAVTPLDWAKILQAAGAFRQPLWAASFVLEAMSPIPADYFADKYWK